MTQAFIKTVAGLAMICTLSGCFGVVAGGAATGAAVAHDRRTTGAFVEDQSIEIKAIQTLRSDDEINQQAHINVTSYNGIVLLSGETPTDAMRARAESLVSGIDKVRRVSNELEVSAPSSLMTRSSDTYITTKVKTVLIGISDPESGFDATRVKVVTENGTVFLMGMLRRNEADAAVEAARQVSGVQRVVKLFEYLD